MVHLVQNVLNKCFPLMCNFKFPRQASSSSPAPVRSFSNEFLINFVDFKISKWIMEINEKPTFRVRLVCSKQLASLQLISSDSDLFFHRILHNPIIVLENTM